jgi:hypothetical protein
MRICSPLGFAAATFFVAATAIAAPAPAPAPASMDQSASSLVTVQTIGASTYRLPTADAAALAGSYGLSSGETMRVSFERSRLFAELGERKSELVPIGGNSFAARGTGMRLTFDQVPFATDVVVSGR